MKATYSLLAAFLVTPAFAIEAPVDDAPPPPLIKGQAPAFPQANTAPKKLQNPRADVAPAGAAAFLGLVTADLPELLASHLNLQPGEGIVVRALMPDGPSAKAGLAVHDVITRVADQVIGSPRELTQFIAGRKVGEKLNIDLIRQGKPTHLEITLGSRPPEIAASTPSMGLNGGNATPQPILPPESDNFGQVDPRSEIIRQMHEQMQHMMEQGQAAIPDVLPPATGTQGTSQATIRMMDGEGSIELRSRNGSKEVTLRDQSNTTVWSGPWNTEEDKAAAPPDVAKRMARLNLDGNFQGNGLRFNLNPELSGER